MTWREQAVANARAWLGTPYHSHARVQGAGVDCAQLLAAVYAPLGVALTTDTGDYAREWHLHRGEELFLGRLDAAGAVPVDTPQPGDIAVYRFGRCFSHGAVVVPDGAVIHSYYGIGVILTGMDEHPLGGRAVTYRTFNKE